MMKHCYKFLSLVAAAALLSLGSCELYNPEEEIPAYIRIEKIDLSTDYATEGTNSHKITDAWVYVDEKLIGCFELPVTIPVLYEGNHQVKVRAGIKVNGIAATRAPYPFYTIYEQSVDFKPTTKITLHPVVEYASFATLDFREDFDGGAGMNIADSPRGTDTSMQYFTEAGLVFEGGKSGAAYLDHSHYKFECVSGTSYVLPKAGAPVFLELNYKCNNRFIIGVFAHSGSSSNQIAVLGVNPSDTWNKIYANLTPAVSGSGNATDFSVFIGMLNSDNRDSVGLLLDNLKLVH